MGYFIAILAAYTLGSSNMAYYISRLKQVDIRKNGKIAPVELNRIWEITECVGYWRKFAPLQQWMLENALSDENDCLEHVIYRR